jgi:DNA polymerase I
MIPEAGIHFNNVVVDFESMYPSLIDRYNLSYETIDCSHKEEEKIMVPRTEHHACTKRSLLGTHWILEGLADSLV